MTEALHPNMSLLMKLDIRNLDSCNSVFAEDFTWHYFNPRLTELEGDTIEFDAVVIWRIVNDKFTEAWDIPAVNTVRSINDAEDRW